MGISIGLTRLFYVLNEQGLLSDEIPTAPCDVLVLPMTEELGPAIAAATALRKAGIRTQLYGEKRKFKAKMSYADKLGVPFIILMGEDEIRDNVLSVKDMRSGEQQKLGADEAIAFLRAAVEERNRGALIVA